jgi:acyl-CoA thioesterase-1
LTLGRTLIVKGVIRGGRFVCVWVVVVAALVGGCSPAKVPTGGTAPQTQNPTQPGTSAPGDAVRYLAMGDSLTQGIGATDLETGTFPALLAAKWTSDGCQVELKNVGISGYTAGQILAEQVPAVAEFQPTLITFQGGGNDIVNGVTEDEYRKNVSAVLDAAKNSGARVVVFAQNEWFRSPEGLNYGTEAELSAKRDALDKILIDEAKSHGAQFVDLRPLYKQQADQSLWVEDGIHPTPAAYEAWATEMATAVPAPCK